VPRVGASSCLSIADAQERLNSAIEESPLATTSIPLASESQQESILRPDVRWPAWATILFRFVVAYVLLYALPFPLGKIRWVSKIADLYSEVWHEIVPWVGAHVLHLSKPITYFVSGSGDKTSDWVQLFCQLVLAVAATVLWSVIDWRRKSYALLHAWMRVYLATYLGVTMFGYGLAKVIPSQMPYPILSHMMEPFGYQSPMGLLWSSIGASTAYEIFTGVVETVAAILFFIPRLTALAALATIAAIGNVFMLNMCYDIPVKQFSAHLVMFSALLLIPDLKRLRDFFVLNRATEPERPVPLFRRRILNYAVWGARLALAVTAIYGGLTTYGKNYSSVKDLPRSNPMYGIWAVDQFTLDGKEYPPLTTDTQRWRRMIFDLKTSAAIQDMEGVPLRDSTGAPIRFVPTVDQKKKTLALKNPTDSNWSFAAKYDRPQPGLMTMDAQWNGHTLHLTLRREEPRFFLSTRGFHWVNETSLNR